MNNSTIAWGIIGCGDVTEVKSGPAFNKVPHSRLVAVMRRDAAKAKDYAARHSVPKWYSNADDLINDDEVNAIYVATPPLHHEEYTTKALKAGKPVYVEKPMAVDAEAAQRMVDAANETGVKLSVAHYRRQQPLFLKIKSLLAERAIGDVQNINLQFSQTHQNNNIAKTDVPWRLDPAVSGGGLFHDLAPHQLDLMLYFFGKPSSCTGSSKNTGGLYEADDTVNGEIIFENNVRFAGAWQFTADEKKDVCQITGTNGEIVFSVFDHQPLRLVLNGAETLLHFDSLQHVQQPMIEKVVQYFLGEVNNPCSAKEGVEVMKMIDAFTKRL